MPIYEYRCRSCNSVFEEFVRSREQKILCPNCNSQDLLKLMSLSVQIGGESKGGGSSCSSCSSGSCSTCR
ncbi:MAG: zinc ribbon domain-containing protein [Deltaproteobacteria bacterium]|nr:zinc ribbon domain-containing protein [Deltaproteobacteria bacterium]